MNDETQYRLLGNGETVQAGDEMYSGGKWQMVPSVSTGKVVTPTFVPIRRALSGLNPEAVGEVVEALEELCGLMQGVIDGDYTPDSFTLQPANAAIAKLREVKP